MKLLARNFVLGVVLIGEDMKLINLPQTAILALVLTLMLGCSAPKSQGPPAMWRNVNGGMTQQEISRLIGPPSQSSAQGGDVWIKSGWQLQVDYDQYGRARNILSRPTGR